MALLDSVFQATSGITSKLPSSGIVGAQAAQFKTRMATVQAASTPQAKITALAGTFGMRLKTLGSGFGAGASGSGSGTHAAPSGISLQAGPTESALKKAFQS
jgi:hypothetical protein